MKTTEINLDPKKSAKEVHKALVTPIRTLAKILRKKLKGAYGCFNTQGWICLKELHRNDLKDDFPGKCHIESADGKRLIVISIDFEWWHFRTHSSLKIDLIERNDRPNRHYWVALKRLDDSEFINGIKDWLKGNKKFDDLPWEKWRI